MELTCSQVCLVAGTIWMIVACMLAVAAEDRASSICAHCSLGNDSDEKYMQMAVELAKITNPKLPFATLIVNKAEDIVLCSGVNSGSVDRTLHGEMVAIRNCSRIYGATLAWNELTLYTTAEPCPMCQSAIMWVGIGEVVYGTSIPSLIQYGWQQITIRAFDVINNTKWESCSLVGGVLETTCNALFAGGPPAM